MMKLLKPVVLAIVFVFGWILGVRSGSAKINTQESNPTDLSNDTKQAYEGFALRLVQEFIKPGTKQPMGAGGISPISIAYLLAVARTGIWPSSTDGFEKVLQLGHPRIQESYQEIIEHLANDPQLSIHSDVLTSAHAVKISQNVSDLRTKVSYIDYNGRNTNFAITQANNMLAAQTSGHIYHGLLPLGGWYGTAVFNWTRGVFLNTLDFDGEWDHPFHSVAVMGFDGSSTETPFLEASGNFSVLQADEYRAIRIPFKNSSKALTLVQPRNGKGVDEFLEADFGRFLEKHGNPDGMQTMDLRIRVPSFNFSSMNSFTVALKNMGLQNPSFTDNMEDINTFDAFVQSSYAHLGKDKFKIASASGTTLTNIKEFCEILRNCKGRNGSSKDDIAIDDDKVSEMGTEEESKTLISPATTDTAYSVDSSLRNPDRIFLIDAPFIWYVEDEGLGPLVLGKVASLPMEKDPEKVREGFEWLPELNKYKYWAYPAKH